MREREREREGKGIEEKEIEALRDTLHVLLNRRSRLTRFIPT